MELDQAKLFNLVLEKTSQKVTELQQRLILAESQLQLVVELNEKLQSDLAKINRKEKKSEFQN